MTLPPGAPPPDPRRVLRTAAERRLPCELIPRDGDAVHGVIEHVEQAGLVVRAPGRRFAGGEDLRIWLALDGRSIRFEASVLRAGVPVADRSQDGLLLGFIDRWVEAPLDAPEPDPGLLGCRVEVLPPNGPPVSLLVPPARIVDVSLRELAFTLPTTFTLVFVQAGTVRVRLGLPDRPPVEVQARVHTLSPGDGGFLYGLVFQQVDDADLLREICDGLQRRL